MTVYDASAPHKIVSFIPYFWLVTMLQKMKKNVLLWGPLFVGAPVRPNLLNMPKSASDIEPFRRGSCTSVTDRRTDTTRR